MNELFNTSFIVESIIFPTAMNTLHNMQELGILDKDAKIDIKMKYEGEDKFYEINISRKGEV